MIFVGAYTICYATHMQNTYLTVKLSCEHALNTNDKNSLLSYTAYSFVCRQKKAHTYKCEKEEKHLATTNPSPCPESLHTC